MTLFSLEFFWCLASAGTWTKQRTEVLYVVTDRVLVIALTLVCFACINGLCSSTLVTAVG